MYTCISKYILMYVPLQRISCQCLQDCKMPNKLPLVGTCCKGAVPVQLQVGRLVKCEQNARNRQQGFLIMHMEKVN